MSEAPPSPNQNFDYHKENPEGYTVEWELVEPGSVRWKQLVAKTMTDGFLQTASAIYGFTENIADDNPRLAPMKNFYTEEAVKLAWEHAEDLRVFRDLLIKPNNQVPVVKKYGDNPDNDLISLSKLRELDLLKQKGQETSHIPPHSQPGKPRRTA